MNYLIGIDGGGTSCRAVVATGDGILRGTGKSGAANIVTDLAGALAHIVEASNEAILDAGLTSVDLGSCSAVLGLAGANIGKYSELLLPLLPFQCSHIVTDARIALEGALAGNNGAVGIIGTGSVFISNVDGVLRSIGGWGFAVGDLCSGARLGRSLLQEVLLAHDKVRSGSELTEAVMVTFQDDPSMLVEYAQTAKPGDFGTFAPLVFEFAVQDDPIAVDIVANAVNDLEESLSALIRPNDIPFCLLGGLAPNYSNRLSAEFKKCERIPQGNALQGALSMAVTEFGHTVDDEKSFG